MQPRMIEMKEYNNWTENELFCICHLMQNQLRYIHPMPELIVELGSDCNDPLYSPNCVEFIMNLFDKNADEIREIMREFGLLIHDEYKHTSNVNPAIKKIFETYNGDRVCYEKIGWDVLKEKYAIKSEGAHRVTILLNSGTRIVRDYPSRTDAQLLVNRIKNAMGAKDTSSVMLTYNGGKIFGHISREKLEMVYVTPLDSNDIPEYECYSVITNH